MAERIDNVAEVWRSRLKGATAQMTKIEAAKTVDGKRAWNLEVRVLELEDELTLSRAKEESALRELRDLHRQLRELRASEQRHRERAMALERENLELRARGVAQEPTADFQREVMEIRAEGEQERRRSAELATRNATLEEELADLRSMEECHNTQYQLQLQRLEQEFADERTRGRQANALLCTQINELERELTEVQKANGRT